jgi:hypothetical protein
MKNKAINTLTYTGTVRLYQQLGNKRLEVAQIHNAGGNALFEFFADCLVGNFDKAKATRPVKIQLVTKTVGTDTYEYFNIGATYMITYPEKIKTSGYGARYSFIISKEDLAEVAFIKNIYLALYTDRAKDPNDFSAICELKLDQNNLANTALLIDWELIVSNKNEDT